MTHNCTTLQVSLVDRHLDSRDIVRRVSQVKDGQNGYVCDVRVQCDLRAISTKTLILKVDSTDLLSITVGI